MKKTIVFIFIFLLIFDSLGIGGEFISTLDKEKRKLETLKAQIREIEKELNKIKKAKSGLIDYLKRLENGLSSIENNINKIKDYTLQTEKR